MLYYCNRFVSSPTPASPAWASLGRAPQRHPLGGALRVHNKYEVERILDKRIDGINYPINGFLPRATLGGLPLKGLVGAPPKLRPIGGPWFPVSVTQYLVMRGFSKRRCSDAPALARSTW